ncbi:MAG: hypothetical protein D8M58_06000 [Calditrichaeota bacterium]|nr:MAG: hypothetical protein DWQ03_20505 [Calditrichota bacterium]MBL1204931.1 hypothetical protein [Calditrichota bacterium]NOG44760.1 hypothetical protein [Calditrichota bacterium]
MQDNKSKMSAADYSPVLTFLLSFFIFHFFDWQDATYFVFSVLVSLLTYNYEVHLLKEERELNRHSKKKTGFHSGLLTIMFLVVFGVAFLDWYKVVSLAWRMGLLMGVVVVYLAILFRAMNTLFYIKMQSPKK